MLCATRKGAREKKGLGVCVAVWLGVIPVVPGVSQRGVLLSCPCAQVDITGAMRTAVGVLAQGNKHIGRVQEGKKSCL